MTKDSTCFVLCEQIWNARLGLLKATCRSHMGEITDLSLSKTQTVVASASTDCTIRVWSLKEGQLGRHLQVITYAGPMNTVVLNSMYSIPTWPDFACLSINLHVSHTTERGDTLFSSKLILSSEILSGHRAANQMCWCRLVPHYPKSLLDAIDLRVVLYLTIQQNCHVNYISKDICRILFSISEHSCGKFSILSVHVQVLTGHGAPVTFIDFHPVLPSAIISCSYDGSCALWDTTSGTNFCFQRPGINFASGRGNSRFDMVGINTRSRAAAEDDQEGPGAGQVSCSLLSCIGFL